MKPTILILLAALSVSGCCNAVKVKGEITSVSLATGIFHVQGLKYHVNTTYGYFDTDSLYHVGDTIK